jgi:hypothetical protein
MKHLVGEGTERRRCVRPLSLRAGEWYRGLPRIDISTVFNERGYVGEVPAITGEKDGAIAESANLIDIYEWFTEVGQRFVVISAENIHRVWSGKRSLGVMGLRISNLASFVWVNC